MEIKESAFQARLQKKLEIYRAEHAREVAECTRWNGIKQIEVTPVTVIWREKFQKRRILSDEEILKIPLMVVRHHLEERKKWPQGASWF